MTQFTLLLLVSDASHVATVFMYTCLFTVLGTIVEGPSNVTYIPGLTPLPIELICNGTGFLYWQVDGLCYFLSSLTNGELPGHNRIGSNILVNSPVNNTEYICVTPSYDFTLRSIYSDPAYIIIAGKTCIHIWQLFVYIYCTLRGRDQREAYFHLHIVHFKGTSVLYLPKLQKIQHTCQI